MNKESGFTWKLGMFVTIGLALFVATVYFVGKNQNLFGSTFHLKSEFKTVSGLKVGNNVRFAGINIGTVDDIEMITDSTVMVVLLIKKNVQKYIKTDARASIASDGLMGDKVLTISPGVANDSVPRQAVKNNDLILSKNAIEMEDVMSSVKTSVDNAAVITTQLAQFSYKLNNGNGALSKLISDNELSKSISGTISNLNKTTNQISKFSTKLNDGKIDSTLANLQSGSKGLSDNMEAAKHNILFRGYFKKKKRAEEKKTAGLKKQEYKNKANTGNKVPEKYRDSIKH